ncbi:hypothetical protein TUM17576_25980 [Enterobacter hormaechei]|nr:hypothetical protein TUM17576_25980 [Enterobacter hormaechei]
MNGTHLPSRIFPLTLALSLREREPIVLTFCVGIPSPLRSGTEPVTQIRRNRIRDNPGGAYACHAIRMRHRVCVVHAI